ncbi:hypothetical protein [Actinomadura sp. SCN-SB]|uniref:hypothetical protein n=1 Tax=Actinomadura sp. SCN-SB TaxID=3373092 RepID=UPI003753CECF
MTPRTPLTRRRRSLSVAASTAGTVTLTLALTSCAVDSGPGGLKLTDVSRESSAQSYARTLTSSATSLTTALAAIEDATRYTDVSQRLSAARRAADQAKTSLNLITPPREAAGAHSRLVLALFQFSRDMAATDRAVQDQRLCTMPAVRYQVGSSDGAKRLREAVAQLRAAQGGYSFPATIADPGELTERRERNGRFLKSGRRGGRGNLTIDNNGDQDAVVSLTRNDKAVFVVYVRSKSKATIRGVPDGTYTLFYTTGVDWDSGAKRFSRDCSTRENLSDTVFQTTVGGGFIRWRNWTYIIAPDGGGNAPSAPVEPDDFPAD